MAMRTFPVCSATAPPTCYCLSQRISFQAGLRLSSPLWKVDDVRGTAAERVIWGLQNGSHLREVHFKTEATKFLSFHVTERCGVSTTFTTILPHSNDLVRTELSFSNKLSGLVGITNGPHSIGRRDLHFLQTVNGLPKGDLNYVENSPLSSPEDKLLNFSGQFIENTNMFSDNANRNTTLTVDARVDIASENSISVLHSQDVSGDAFYKLKTSILEFLSEVSASIDYSVDKGDRVINNIINEISSSMKGTFKNVNEAIDSAVHILFPTVVHRELFGNEWTGFSRDLKEAISKGGIFAVDILRGILVNVEDFLASGTTFIVYYYGSAKEFLPPKVLYVLNSIEETAKIFLMPVWTAFEQVYIAIEVLERYLGLDPSDPLLQFLFFLGTSSTIGITYQILTFGGYAGDLSPKLCLELLTAEDNFVLVDVRPEELQGRDGIPDLRRRARFKYASVALPKIDGPVKSLVKSGKDLDDALMASVIRNLRIVKDRSNVIVLDADGTHSKGIARSLRKLGVKKPYLVQGGFQSWVKNGLCIKQLKPETTFSILNEEAEAIIVDIKPTPVQVVGYGLGFVAASYALYEWEMTLKLVGIIGLSQSIYQRVASYDDSEDFKRDIRLLLAPLRLGAKAFSWAAGKLEPSRIGLPTSPSSSDVQTRVLLAAAKHESQPSDAKESQELSGENIDLSEAT